MRFARACFLLFVGAALASAQNLLILERLLERASDYDYGKSRAALVEIERLLPRFLGAPDQQAAEQKLIGALPAASPGLTEFLCRQLALVGGEASVEPLVALLSKPEAAGIAVHTLGRISGDEVPRRLREVIAKAGDKEKAGIVWIIGEKRDQAWLPILTGFLSRSNDELAGAAALALGKIGTRDALQALGTARSKASGDLKLRILEAELICAESLPDAGRFYAALRDADLEPQYRAAALRGSILADPGQTGRLILSALRSTSDGLVAMAVSMADHVKDDSELKQIAQALPSLSPSNQVRLLGALERSGGRAVLPVVVSAVGSSHQGVRIAALQTLAAWGDGSAVQAVAAAAAVDPAARQTLDAMPGVGVNQKIAELLPAAAPAVQAELARAAGTRRITDALPALRKAAVSDDAGLRSEAIRSLGRIGLVEDQALLIRMLSAPEAEDALVAIATRTKSADAVLAAAQSVTDPKTRTALLRVLVRLEEQRAMELIQQALGSSEWEVRTGAVRALALWPSPLPMKQLWQIAVTDNDLPRHASALDGFIRMAVESRNLSVVERVALVSDAITIARRPDERRRAVAALADMPSLEALRLAVSCAAVEELRPIAKAVVGAISQRFAGPNDQHVAAALQAVSDEPTAR